MKEQLFIRKKLTVIPFVPKSSPAKPMPFRIFRESLTKFYIPRYWGINTYGLPEKNNLYKGNQIDVHFKGKLRDMQKSAVDAYLKSAHLNGGGLLELYCGFGKTVCALYIISKLKKKTLIIVHKSFLMNQWIERINQFLPNAKIGIIQGKTIDIEDKDIVIGMLQSLSMKDYPTTTFASFGFTIIDEVHHIGAEVFSRSLFKITTKCMLGLSATMKRKDGLTKIFKMFIGDVVFSKKRKTDINVEICVLNYKSVDESFLKNELNYRGNIQYASMIKKLCECEDRSNFIIDILIKIIKESPDRQLMILAHNKNVLNYLYEEITKKKIASVGYYIGGMKKDELKKSESKKIIIATYAMAEEALDIKTLNTLIMCTPKTDVVQAIGRILRSEHIKPLVVDIVDPHDVFKRQWYKRHKYYKKQNYIIKKMTTLEEGPKNNLLQGICLID